MRKKVVIPGEMLAIAEEFTACENAFQEGEKIYASTIGVAEYDKKSHEVRVQGRKNVKPFAPGCRVIGQVLAVRKSRVLVKLFEAMEGPEPRVLTQSYATLFISNVDNRFVEDLTQEFKIGDIIAAEIDSIKPYGLYLRTDKPSLGVIRAYCSKCRAPLYLKDNKLFCKRCGSIEKRKLSVEYTLTID